MKAGINRRIRVTNLQHGRGVSLICAFGPRCLPTKHGHAVLCSSDARVIREYRCDSLSKRPVSSVLLGFGLSQNSQRLNE